MIVSAPVSSGGLYSHLRNVMPHLLRLRPDWDFEVYAPQSVLADVFGRTDAPWMRPLRNAGAQARGVWEFSVLPRMLREDGRALLLAPFGPFWNVRLARRAVVRLENLIVLLEPDERVVSPSDRWRLRVLRHVYLANARRALRPVCASLHSRGRYVALTGLRPDRFAVIPHGVDVEGVRAAVAGPEIARIIEEPFVLTIGQATPYRQTRELILAYRLLADRSGASLPTLVWAGSARRQDEGYEGDCLRLLEPLRRAGQAIHLPQISQDQVFALVRAARLFVHPSVHEDCPNTIFEALAAGAPTICSDIPANREFIADAAELLADSRPPAWADAIEALLASSDRRAALSEKARERARKLRWDDTARLLAAELDAGLVR